MYEDERHDPLSRSGVEQLVHDCTLLLDYLSRVPDARMDWCFEETRGRAAGNPPVRLAAPPAQTPTKAAFLEALTGLGSKVRDAPPGPFPLTAEEVGLLLAARDFLSAIAWPASVETIRVTQAYCTERRRLRRSLSRRVKGWLLGNRQPDMPEEDRAAFYGRRIASRRDRYQAMLVCLAAVTIWLSFQTLVGQRLVVESTRFVEDWTAHEAVLNKAIQDDIHLLRGEQLGKEGFLERQPGLQRYCDYAVQRKDPPQQGPVRSGGTQIASADGSVGAQPDPAMAERPRIRTYFLSLNHQRICDTDDGLRRRAAGRHAALVPRYRAGDRPAEAAGGGLQRGP